MGYTPNAVAQSLKGQRTQHRRACRHLDRRPFYGPWCVASTRWPSRPVVDVFLGVSYNDPVQEMAVIESFHRRRVDGIITASSRLSDEQLAGLIEYAIPTVLFNRQSDGRV